MSKTKIITVLIVLILAVGAIFIEESKPVEKKQPMSKRPENFTEGVWIKKYPFNYACFKFETPDGIKIVSDPFEMDETVSADIVTESHQDADHVDTSKLTGLFKLYQWPGEFEEKGIKVTGIGGRHNKGDKAVTNTVFVFDINGIKIAHFASQGQVPSEEMWAKLKAFNGIDVLLVQAFKNPNYYLEDIKMTLKECCGVIDRLNPKIVIPEHGTTRISEDFANHYHTQVEYINYDGFVVTKDILKSIKGHRFLDMDNKGPIAVEPEKDKKMIRKAIEDVFDAYNSADNAIITSILHKYINPDQCKLVFNDMAADMNSIIVNGIVIYKDGFDLRDNKFTLVDSYISIFSDKAAVTGYVDGSVSIPGKEVEKGPWKISCCMYKSGDNWFIEYIKLMKFDMIKLEYYPQLPKNYGKDPNKKWPLIVFLHGAGEWGGTLDDVKKMNHSIPMMASTSKDFPFVAVSPLCPQFFSWKELWYSINNMIDEVTAKYNIDPDRIYLTGLSLGGIGTWSTALQFPDKFAAIAPVCGSVDPDKVEKLKNLPIWAFHGAKDTVVPMDQEQKAVDVLKACGGNIKYTVYPDVEHDAWNKAYPNKELYAWFLQHTRTKNKPQK